MALTTSSGETEVGMRRLALSDSDKTARDWFRSTCQSLGCKVTVDSMGNMFAVRPGLREGAPTYAGSHLDTQPTGGRYDGILGVTAGIEMLRALKDNVIETTYPVGVVNWTNEEGARFPMSMMASGVWSGDISLDHAHSVQEVGGGKATVKSELQRIGYLGETPASHESVPIAAHFELHIEQGPTLEAEQRKIGVVQGVQSYKWFTVEVKGRESHTGATRFEHRADAMLAASKMILYSHRAATRAGALASTGVLKLSPGSTNTVPGRVSFSLDIRSPREDVVELVEADCKEAFAKIAAGETLDILGGGDTASSRQCSVKWTTDTVSPAVLFHKDCINCVESAVEDLYGPDAAKLSQPLTSGAGHDSVYTSKRVPTTMIFIPCRDGVSHHPSEYSTPEDCGIGAQVLMGAVLHYDRLRAGREK